MAVMLLKEEEDEVVGKTLERISAPEVGLVTPS
jgi:hypothetical protein